jgi:hypothetical protein
MSQTPTVCCSSRLDACSFRKRNQSLGDYHCWRQQSYCSERFRRPFAVKVFIRKAQSNVSVTKKISTLFGTMCQYHLLGQHSRNSDCPPGTLIKPGFVGINCSRRRYVACMNGLPSVISVCASIQTLGWYATLKFPMGHSDSTHVFSPRRKVDNAHPVVQLLLVCASCPICCFPIVTSIVNIHCRL